MTDHLPECPMLDVIPFVDEGWDEGPCICDRLRACEQRVLRDAVNSDAVRGAIRIAEQRTLDAAREAVERVSSLLQPLGPALAAIDALREES